MKIGVLMYPVEGGVVDVARFARRAEELGFESVWAPEHTIVPVTSETPAPLGYDNIPDPIVALGVACGATTTLLLGTAVCLVPEHDPILHAKQVATLDRQSGGRFLLGIGVGWLREESEILGGDFPRRWTQAREAVAAMKALWTQDVAEFHGRYYEFPPVWCYPKPAQQPHPPVILGSKSAMAFERIVAWGDGWIPNGTPPEEVAQGRATLDRLAEAAGRDPATIQITAGDIPFEPDLLPRYEAAGAERATFKVRMAGDKESLRQLEEIALKTLG